MCAYGAAPELRRAHELLVSRDLLERDKALVPHNGSGPAPLGRYLRIPDESLLGVIFGAGMSSRDRRRLASLAQKHGRALQFFKTGIHRRRYELDLAECSHTEIFGAED